MAMTAANLDAVEKEPRKWRSPLTPTSKNRPIRAFFINEQLPHPHPVLPGIQPINDGGIFPISVLYIKNNSYPYPALT